MSSLVSVESMRLDEIRRALQRGTVIPAHPLALDEDARLDERHQRALSRYYIAAGAGGLAVGVHTTQFSIREHGLYRPVLELARDVALQARRSARPVLVAGIAGTTDAAVAEASVARDVGFDVAMPSLAALPDASDERLLEHCAAVAEVMPLFGFYLQPAVGGRRLSREFWREFCLIPNVVAIKVSPFNRYATLDVVRGVAESGRADEIALYTGNDDAIVSDLVTPLSVGVDGTLRSTRFVGGLLGHWAIWTHRAVEQLELCRAVHELRSVPESLLTLGAQITEANAAVFDVANGFRGCIAGIHYVLYRQGLLGSMRCLSDREVLSAGQADEIDRVRREYPWLTDDDFVSERLEDLLH